MSKNTSLAVGSLFVFALGCAPLTSNGEPTREQSAVTTLTSAPAPEPASADSADAVDPSQVEVVEHRVIQPPRSSDDRENRWRQLHVWGEMRNKSSRTLSRITADVLFFDARGKLLATESIASGTKTDLGDATPGEPISSAVHDVPPGVAVGAVAWATGRLQPVVEVGGWRGITEAQMAEIRFDELPPDTDIVASMGPAALESPSGLEAKLAAWAPGRLDDAGQSIRNLVAAAAIADLSADPAERAIARLVFRRIRAAVEPPAARQALAWVILDPDNGTVIRKAPELGLPRHPPERLVRQRSVIYAKKFLGRLLGRLPD
jgi:hypothetical protein